MTTDILVRVKDSFMDLMGQTGVIRSVTVRNGREVIDQLIMGRAADQ